MVPPEKPTSSSVETSTDEPTDVTRRLLLRASAGVGLVTSVAGCSAIVDEDGDPDDDVGDDDGSVDAGEESSDDGSVDAGDESSDDGSSDGGDSGDSDDGGDSGDDGRDQHDEDGEPDDGVETTTELGQHGITWTFDDEYQYGQFVTGDYWVVGPVTITGIDPPSESGGRVENGSMIDPSADVAGTQGYDSAANVGYDGSLNVALDVSPDDPLVVDPGSSLVSTISGDDASDWPALTDAAVLTVLESPPPAGSFRPPYFGADTSTRYTVDDLDYSPLARLDPVAGTPDLAAVASQFDRPWIDQFRGWATQTMVPEHNLPNYGREYAVAVGKATLLLNLDVPDEEKEPLLVRIAQLGIDTFAIVQDGSTDHWRPNGGHNQGRKWPILFAGLVLDDAEMQSIGERSGAYLHSGDGGAGDPPPGYVHFGMDSQTFYVEETDPGVYNDGHGGYTDEHVGLPEWGIRHATDPSRDDASWGASYRQCCTANSMVGQVLSAHVMEVTDLWNHDALFDYQDRYMGRIEAGYWHRSWDDFAEAMWDEYRGAYGERWEPE